MSDEDSRNKKRWSIPGVVADAAEGFADWVRRASWTSREKDRRDELDTIRKQTERIQADNRKLRDRFEADKKSFGSRGDPYSLRRGETDSSGALILPTEPKYTATGSKDKNGSFDLFGEGFPDKAGQDEKSKDIWTPRSVAGVGYQAKFETGQFKKQWYADKEAEYGFTGVSRGSARYRAFQKALDKMWKSQSAEWKEKKDEAVKDIRAGWKPVYGFTSDGGVPAAQSAARKSREALMGDSVKYAADDVTEAATFAERAAPFVAADEAVTKSLANSRASVLRAFDQSDLAGYLALAGELNRNNRGYLQSMQKENEGLRRRILAANPTDDAGHNQFVEDVQTFRDNSEAIADMQKMMAPKTITVRGQNGATFSTEVAGNTDPRLVEQIRRSLMDSAGIRPQPRQVRAAGTRNGVTVPGSGVIFFGNDDARRKYFG